MTFLNWLTGTWREATWREATWLTADVPDAVTIPDNIKWGYGPVVTPVKTTRQKTRQQHQNEQLVALLLM